MTPDPAESNVIAQQFARFGQVCRVYAPVYRQITLAGLRRVMGGGLDALSVGVRRSTMCGTHGSITWSTTTRAAVSC